MQIMMVDQNCCKSVNRHLPLPVGEGLCKRTTSPHPPLSQRERGSRISASLGKRFFIWLFSAMILAGAAFPCRACAEGWKAGVAKEKITPQSLMLMAAYRSRNHPATGLPTALWAKA